MNQSRKTTRFIHVFIAAQYLAAMAVILFVTAELSPAEEFLKNLLFYTVIFIIPIFLAIKIKLKESPLSWLELSGSAKAIIIGLVIGAAMFPIFLLGNGFRMNAVVFDLPGILKLAGLILAGLFEEIAFRGFYLKVFQGKLSFAWADTITALLFSALHFRQVMELGIIQLFMLFFLGLFLGYAKEKTKSLWVPVIIHGTFNVLILLFR